MRPVLLIPITLALLAGCGEVPDLQAADSDYVKQADYPTLVPIEDLGIKTEADETTNEATGLASRAQALRNRARRLQGEVIDDADKKRLEQGVIEG